MKLYCCFLFKVFSSSYNTRLTVHFQTVIVSDYRTRYRVELYNGKFDMMPLLANITFNRTLESLSSYSNDLLVRLCHSCDDVRSRSCWNQSDRIELYVVNDDGKIFYYIIQERILRDKKRRNSYEDFD
jgi:hypothetical protein